MFRIEQIFSIGIFCFDWLIQYELKEHILKLVWSINQFIFYKYILFQLSSLSDSFCPHLLPTKRIKAHLLVNIIQTLLNSAERSKLVGYCKLAFIRNGRAVLGRQQSHVNNNNNSLHLYSAFQGTQGRFTGNRAKTNITQQKSDRQNNRSIRSRKPWQTDGTWGPFWRRRVWGCNESPQRVGAATL